MTFSVQVSQHRSLTRLKGIGIAGQPQPHHYFHHPIHPVGGSFGTGMMLDGLEELAFTTASAKFAPQWDDYGEIPPVLAARLRVPGP